MSLEAVQAMQGIPPQGFPPPSQGFPPLMSSRDAPEESSPRTWLPEGLGRSLPGSSGSDPQAPYTGAPGPQAPQVPNIQEITSPRLLREVPLKIVDRNQCKQAYQPEIPAQSGPFGKRQITGGFQVTQNVLCAGVSGGGRDICSGDSGGPLFDTSSKTFIGVVSSGTARCGDAQYPSIYTKTSSYIDFIKSAIDDDGAGDAVNQPSDGVNNFIPGAWAPA